MKRFPLRPAVAAVSLALAGLAHAQDSGITHKISGYGTLAGTFTDSSDAEYVGSLGKFKGADKQLDIGVDSRVGLQGVVNFDSQFSMTAQALMTRRQAKDFDVGMEWLYAQYAPIPEVNVRLGRVLMPSFLLSDSINVGYAQPWMRAPGEVYAQMLTNTVDGVQIGARHNFGSVLLSGQVSTGKSSFSIVVQSLGPVTVPVDHVVSTNLTAEVGNWLARIGQATLHTNVSKDDFAQIGMQYDNGTAVFMSEGTRRHNTTSSYNNKSWYVAGGWRFGKLLPMVTYAALRPDVDNPVVKPVKSVAFSTRYDLASNVAFKAQVTRSDSTASLFINKTANVSSKITVAAFGLDFIF